MQGEFVPGKPRLSFAWLHACSGCEIALLNCGEELLPLLELVDIVRFPLLMDRKDSDPSGGPAALSFPEAEIGLISGAVASEEDLRVLQTMRRQCRILIALGTCATHGGIPALRNQWTADETLRTVYDAGPGSGNMVPAEISALLDRVCSLDEKVRVDVSLPGCPPRPGLMVECVRALLDGEWMPVSGKSVCETCPTRREGRMRPVRRFLDNADFVAGEPLSQMRCLLEQGLLCMGPVTAGGCGGQETPLCVSARVPCRGCYGPVRAGGNQLLDMLNALASNGVDYRTLVDRKAMLRFSGAHGLLKPARKKT
jgi:F420-non-reducing hydrogenase small subunit